MRSRPALALWLALVGALAGCRGGAPEFRIGYMICNAREETHERFDALTAYLSAKTGAHFEAVYLDTGDVETSFGKGELDFAHTNSLLYVILRERSRARLVAAEKSGAFGARTRGVVIARKNSGLRTLADLKGKRMVFGPMWAPFGYLAQYALLLDAGVDPESKLGFYAIPPGSWKHEKILYSVLYGAFDAGAAPLLDLEEMVRDGKIQPDDFTVLGRSDLAPYCTVSAASAVPDHWVEKVRAALVELGPGSVARVGTEELAVLKRARVEGYETLTDGDYETIRSWARKAGMPPYDGGK